ncbi:phosphoribosylformylglycinamidine synthase [Luteolibacter algae]|uniref:Phosphoribosylformylglycinamidine synthase n=1 Tax=Luteolibacter algae TaxID=454151 RepID=A0ABW5DEI2_9BACT
MHTLFVEKRPHFASEARHLLHDLRESLNLSKIASLRLLNRYDIEGISDSEFDLAATRILSEPQVDTTSTSLSRSPDENAFAFSYLPGQFDQRADSAAQCIQILTGKEKPKVFSSRVVLITGELSESELAAIKSYIINPVDSHEIPVDAAVSAPASQAPADVEILESFLSDPPAKIRSELSLAMSEDDVEFTQKYFKEEEKRAPSLTEIRMLDTYWSDHCRHTTFLTAIDNVAFEPGSEIVEETYETYRKVRQSLGRDEKPVTLMDIALIGMRELKASGELDNLEVSEEINAASIVVPVEITEDDSNTSTEEWLVQFKNETHNHPTEIEPFGGAATCLGGCIRDPLSGRSYVYQAMRVTGAANPLTPFSETLPGKLPQKKICQVAAKGYSSYGNQIGLATGQVAEVYHPGYVAKRLEIGAVVAAAPRKNVFRGSPSPGDVILLIGGRTGRDGVGGATGSSKEHTETALENSAEVQKGDAPTERKIQRLFRNTELTRKIKICNDFGAGGVSVAIGEIAPSLVINLDAVPKKYEGLDGTELAISESQERMAVCVDPSEIDFFIREADKENLECVHVADVTDSGRLIMTWRGKKIVDLSRAFLDTNGVQQKASVVVTGFNFHDSAHHNVTSLEEHLSSLNIASQKGLGEMFDGSVGAGTVLWPFGGKNQLTAPEAMVAKLPLMTGETDAATYMAWGFDPQLSAKSPFHGAAYAVTESVCKAVAAGARLSDIRLTLQEFFPRLGGDPKRWGLPFAALLGAFRAQHELRLAAIGGKDSMSGSFNELDVPPTLVSFALAPGSASLATSPEFKQDHSTVSIVETPILENGLPDFEALKQIAASLHELNKAGNILALHHIGPAGLAATLTKMALGNGIGISVDTDQDFYTPRYFSFVIEHHSPITGLLPTAKEIGRTQADRTLTLGSEKHNLCNLESAWRKTLEPIYPTSPAADEKEGTKQLPEPAVKSLSGNNHKSKSSTKPRVLIPTFPGTNSEYDSARAFSRVGAETKIEVFRNLSATHIEQSISALADEIKKSQILFIPGGFSSGDEPDGSAKFIATILRNPIISDAIGDLLENRDGLILGICNGFQALVKTGLVTHGIVLDTDSESATLVHNDISRHISQYVSTKVTNNASPWLANMKIGEIHTIPVSHGEGKFFASKEVLAQLADNGQIATQYCDATGSATMEYPFNPNGSLAAIEGITSPCGRVFGKMAHSERFSRNVAKNIPGFKDQPIFEAGVSYFG